MQTFELYSLVPFDRGAKARWLLTEASVEYKDHVLNREAREHEGSEFLKLNPMGRVPVLKHGDQAIFESGAICAYLADLLADRGLAPAIGSPLRGVYQQWMYFASSTLDTIQTRIMVIEDIPAGEVQKTKLAALQEEVRDACFALDRTLSQDSFLVGNRFSAADICVSYHFYWLKLWPELEAMTRDFPRVTAYIERMKAMPSAIQAKVFSYEE